MKYNLHTFGCKVNTYDTGLIQKNLSQNGYTLGKNANENGGIHVLNTCAVTAEATKEAVRVIRRIKAKDPLAMIVVTGCAAQVDTQIFSELPSVDLVVANSHKGLLPFILEQYFKGDRKEKVFKSNIFRKEDLEAGGGIEEKHSRAFLKIQDGCNSFCTYCIIPYARGKSRSIGVGDLVRRVSELYDLGYREVVLTGVHVGDYEVIENGQTYHLEDLLKALLVKTQIQRFRLTSLEPGELSEELIEIYQDPRICPHFHMSIQSAEDSVLKGMKRNYVQSEVISSLKKIDVKIKNAFVGMDVIVGFPGETKELFQETYRVLAETPWTKLHVFPFSERQGTRAAVMIDSVPMTERKYRAAQLRDISHHRMQAEALKQIGTAKKLIVLKETKKNEQGLWFGLSRDFWNVAIKSNIRADEAKTTEVEFQKLIDFPSQELTVEIQGIDLGTAASGDTILVGKPVSGVMA